MGDEGYWLGGWDGLGGEDGIDVVGVAGDCDDGLGRGRGEAVAFEVVEDGAVGWGVFEGESGEEGVVEGRVAAEAVDEEDC